MISPLTVSQGAKIYSSIQGLSNATTYYFAIKVQDAAGNVSGVSTNNPSAFTNAQPIVTLFKPNGSELLSKTTGIYWSSYDPNQGDTTKDITIKISSDNNVMALVQYGLPEGGFLYIEKVDV
ncbi:MAG: hypothetical protein QME68_07270, partial [Elusimicrobiota bacterium]|nr:hypothetical protein [Elusimicrobiota bacterium]